MDFPEIKVTKTLIGKYKKGWNAQFKESYYTDSLSAEEIKLVETCPVLQEKIIKAIEAERDVYRQVDKIVADSRKRNEIVEQMLQAEKEAELKAGDEIASTNDNK